MLGLTEHSMAQDTIHFINIEIASVPSTKRPMLKENG